MPRLRASRTCPCESGRRPDARTGPVRWKASVRLRCTTTTPSSRGSGSFPFTASGKALAAGHSAGFVKVVAEPKYGEIVGAHLVGQGATELVAEFSLAMTLECTTTEIAGTTHAHPTLSEAIHEAALLAEGRGINF